jgi:hypothetical protein
MNHASRVWWGAWHLVDDRPVLATGDQEGAVLLWYPGTGQPMC